LRDLGVSHLYLSPSLQARAGSTHGYDVIDPTRVSEELGGEAQLRALASAAAQAGMGIVLDLVPNHMAVDDANRFWTDPSLRERLRDWPVTGTVGYEFLNDACALFIDAVAEPAFTRLWQEVSGDVRSFDEVAREAKLEQATTTFVPEVERLAHTLGTGTGALA